MDATRRDSNISGLPFFLTHAHFIIQKLCLWIEVWTADHVGHEHPKQRVVVLFSLRVHSRTSTPFDLVEDNDDKEHGKVKDCVWDTEHSASAPSIGLFMVDSAQQVA